MTHNNIRLVLPSDSSFEYFPNNTTSNFSVKLATPVRVSDQWEIGLDEVILPNQICNIRKNKNEIVIYRKAAVGSDAVNKSLNFPKRTIYFPPGYYRSVSKIVNFIN